MSVRPRQVTLRGHVEARGFVLSGRVVSSSILRRRVLALWRPGVEVYRDGDLWVVLLPGIRRVDARLAPGAPIVRLDGVLSACPLPAAARSAVAGAGADLAIVDGGRLRPVVLADADKVDPAGWIELGGFSCAEVGPLVDPPEPPAEVEVEPCQGELELHALTRAAGAGSTPEREQLLQALARIDDDQGSTALARRGEARAAARGPSVIQLILPWLARVLDRALSRLGAGAGAGGGEGSRERAQEQTLALTAPLRQPSKLARAAAWVRARLRRLAASRGTIARLIGRQHYRYLRRMVECFERGELDEALHRAIPASAGRRIQSIEPQIGPLRPRTKLAISASTPAFATAPLAWFDRLGDLRALYRQAFDRLDRLGRVEQAAYVLLELLEDDEEGVTYLEKHGQIRRAAEIAETRELDPGLVVRLWWRAGDRARAVLHARRTGAFSDAVVRLERVDPDAALLLRLIWAEHAEAAGDYGAAIDAVWPLESMRDRAREWIDQGIAAGGALAARLLVRRVLLFPADAAATREQACEVLCDASWQRLEERLSLAGELARTPADEGLRGLTSLALRAVVRDRDTLGEPICDDLARALEGLGTDPLLRADLPRRSNKRLRRLRSFDEPQLQQLAASDAGSVPVHDAAPMPGGRTVVALGELGVQILGRLGNVLCHLELPAHRLVLADSGLRALGLAFRDGNCMISKLDLGRRSGAVWGELRLTQFCDSHDGGVWFAALGDQVVALDLMQQTPQRIWRVAEPGLEVKALARSDDCLSVAWTGTGEDEPEVWTYRLPDLVLSSRDRIAALPSRLCPAVTVSPTGAATFYRCGPEGSARPELILCVDGEPRGHLAGFLPGPMDDYWFAAHHVLSEGPRIVAQLLDLERQRPRLVVSLDGASTLRCRLSPGIWTLCDDLGRVLAYDTQTGRLRRWLRI